MDVAVDDDSPEGETESGSVFSPTADELEIEEEEDESAAAVEEEDAEDLDDIVDEREPNFTWNEYIDFSTDLEGLPPQWPTFEVVNLDRRLPVKFKRHDYEPIVNPTTANLSNSFQDSSFAFYETSKLYRAQDFNWSELEKEIFLPYILHYGPNSKEMYEHLLGIVSKQYLEDPTTPITLADLRKLSPDTPLLFLVSLQTLMMNMQEINSSPPLNNYHFTENVLGFKHSYNHSYYKAGIFSCFSCLKDCSVARYESLRDWFVICADCFDCGKYPYSMTSSHFQFRVAFLTSSSSDLPEAPNWSPREVLELLDAVEKCGMDWGQISNHVGRPDNDCMYKFASLSTPETSKIHKTASMEMMLKSLIGNASNPTMSLVNLLLNCAHPNLGAEAAKSALHTLCKSPANLIELDDNWAAAVEGFIAAIQLARKVVKEEELVLEGLHDDLLHLQIELLQLKLAIYEERS